MEGVGDQHLTCSWKIVMFYLNYLYFESLCAFLDEFQTLQ